MRRPVRNCAGITALLLLLAAGHAFSQQSGTDDKTKDGDEQHAGQASEARRLGFGIGLQYDRVLRATVDLGVFAGKDLKRDGPFGAIAVDVGQGGIRYGVGYGLRHLDGFILARLAVLETKSNPGGGIDTGQRFIGPDLRIGTMGLTIGAGYYWRVAGAAPGDQGVATLSVGLLF